MLKKSIIVLSLMVLVLVGEESMAFGKVSLFSEVEGVVLHNGQPVTGASVERSYRWHWGDKQGTDNTTSDSDGTFKFPEITERSFTASIVPHEPVIEQKIMITVDGNSFKGWVYAKHNYDAQGELGGKPMRLVCEISLEPEYRETYGAHSAFGICRFD